MFWRTEKKKERTHTSYVLACQQNIDFYLFSVNGNIILQTITPYLQQRWNDLSGLPSDSDFTWTISQTELVSVSRQKKKNILKTTSWLVIYWKHFKNNHIWNLKISVMISLVNEIHNIKWFKNYSPRSDAVTWWIISMACWIHGMTETCKSCLTWFQSCDIKHLPISNVQDCYYKVV